VQPGALERHSGEEYTIAATEAQVQDQLRLAWPLAPCSQSDYDPAMTALTKPRMNVDEFLAWAEGRPGRYELFRGEVVAMSPETVGHAAIKGAVYTALVAAVRQRRLPCHVLPDGVLVRIDDATAYEPDAQVYCGPEVSRTALEIANPVIVVEVLSPSTRSIDVSVKLAGYFRLPSLAHYLIVDPIQPSITHHSRDTGNTILTRIVTAGAITLDPPRIEVLLSDIYENQSGRAGA
jgi:Uma2 family endonuclease